MKEQTMKFLVFARPVDGIENKLPRSEEFQAQIEWIGGQLSSGRFDCTYHGENHAVTIVNTASREDLDQLYVAMPLTELTTRQVETLEDLRVQMQRVLEDLRKIPP
jgi:hypothetical protein